MLKRTKSPQAKAGFLCYLPTPLSVGKIVKFCEVF